MIPKVDSWFIHALTFVRNRDSTHAEVYIGQDAENFYLSDDCNTCYSLEELKLSRYLSRPELAALISSIPQRIEIDKPSAEITMTLPRPPHTRDGLNTFLEALFDFYGALRYGNAAQLLKRRRRTPPKS